MKIQQFARRSLREVFRLGTFPTIVKILHTGRDEKK